MTVSLNKNSLLIVSIVGIYNGAPPAVLINANVFPIPITLIRSFTTSFSEFKQSCMILSVTHNKQAASFTVI